MVLHIAWKRVRKRLDFAPGFCFDIRSRFVFPLGKTKHTVCVCIYFIVLVSSCGRIFLYTVDSCDEDIKLTYITNCHTTIRRKERSSKPFQLYARFLFFRRELTWAIIASKECRQRTSSLFGQNSVSWSCPELLLRRKAGRTAWTKVCGWPLHLVKAIHPTRRWSTFHVVRSLDDDNLINVLIFYSILQFCTSASPSTLIDLLLPVTSNHDEKCKQYSYFYTILIYRSLVIRSERV